ncbi:DUF523 domain-containing protein [bacterium]|nr:DUF523 domain-containing protein [bacterium]
MILISACLTGTKCRYDGGGFAQYPELTTLVEKGEAIPVCPEELGGLPTPRPPAELVGGDGAAVLRGEARIVREDGTDVTEAFLEGARAAARIAEQHGVERAILKARSPSCGCSTVYDGTFTGCVIPGQGVTAALLSAMGLHVTDETTIP